MSRQFSGGPIARLLGSSKGKQSLLSSTGCEKLALLPKRSDQPLRNMDPTAFCSTSGSHQRGRGATAGVRSVLRDARNHGQRRLILVDNLGAAMALEKKRIHVLNLLQHCRRVGHGDSTEVDAFPRMTRLIDGHAAAVIFLPSRCRAT